VSRAHPEPARQCFTWHLAGRIPNAVHALLEDGTPDPYSIRFRCPSHDDHKASAGMSVDGADILYNCFVCKDNLLLRQGLIKGYHIDPACLPLSTKQKAELFDLLDQIVDADTNHHAEVRLHARAALDGFGKGLPSGRELERMTWQTSISRSKAHEFRNRGELPEARPDNPFYRLDEKPVKQRRSATSEKSPEGTRSPEGTTKSPLRGLGHEPSNDMKKAS
jgi:hypothetical protein